MDKNYTEAAAPQQSSYETEMKPYPQDFSTALAHMRNGKKVMRLGWNGRGMWVALQRPDAESKMSLPYIFMHTAQAQRVPWVASQTDILAEDWYIAR